MLFGSYLRENEVTLPVTTLQQVVIALESTVSAYAFGRTHEPCDVVDRNIWLSCVW
jgi:hypothetical protein